MTTKKMSKKGALHFLVVAFVIGIVLVAVGVIKLPTGGSALTIAAPNVPSEVRPTTNNAPKTLCGKSSATVSSIQLDAGDSTQTVTGGYAWSADGSAFTSAATGGTTFIADPQASVKIVFNGNKTQGGGTYFTTIESTPLTCEGAKTITTKRHQNGTVTLRVYNEQSTVVNNAGTNVTMANGEDLYLKLEIQGSALKANAPMGAVVIAEGNSSAFESIQIFNCGTNSLGLASVPSFRTVSNTANSQWAHQIGPLVGPITQTCSLRLKGKTTAASNPVVNGANVVLSFYPIDYYQSQDGSYKLGVQDDNGAQLSIKDFSTVVAVI